MKVKVRRRKPASVAAEQALKKGIAKDHLLDDKQQRDIDAVHNHIRRIKALISTKSDNSNKNDRITDDDIEWYCRDSFLMEIPIKMLADCVNSNIFTKENGERIALVPPLWIWNWITSD